MIILTRRLEKFELMLRRIPRDQFSATDASPVECFEHGAVANVARLCRRRDFDQPPRF